MSGGRCPGFPRTPDGEKVGRKERGKRREGRRERKRAGGERVRDGNSEADVI